jgi:hypothetical protein
MARLGLRVKPIGRLNEWKSGLARNPLCSHLWLGKRNFRYSAAARTAYVNHLIAHVRREFPEAIATLQKWKLAEPQAVNSRHQLDWRTHPPYRGRTEGFFLLRSGSETTVITDAHTPAERIAADSDLVLPGERAQIRGKAVLVPLDQVIGKTVGQPTGERTQPCRT